MRLAVMRAAKSRQAVSGVITNMLKVSLMEKFKYCIQKEFEKCLNQNPSLLCKMLVLLGW